MSFFLHTAECTPNDTTSYKNHKIPSSLIQGVDRDKTGTVSFLAESFSFVAGPVLEMETSFLQEIKWLLSECCTYDIFVGSSPPQSEVANATAKSLQSL